MPKIPTCSGRFGAAARVVGLPARPRRRQRKLAPFRGRQNGSQNASSSEARVVLERLTSLLAARGGGTEALPTARAMEIGARAAGRLAGRQRWHGSSRSRLSSIERTRCQSSGTMGAIQPRHPRCARHWYPHVALGSARLLVQLFWQHARGGGNVNLSRCVARNRPNSCRCAAVPQLLLICVPF